ncbi:tryptophan 7-halogenase [Pelagibacteraceae bacterium]|nr:tryptophan 7-halogenase [Pelagibacteraceae bacterium]
MRKLKNVTILGAGTAGWISAYILSDFFYTNKQDVKVTIVDPSSIPIIGVGEGTTGIFYDFLKRYNLDELDFLRETKATLKFGIVHKDWKELNHQYYGPIDDPHLLASKKDPEDFEYLNVYAVAAGRSVADVHLHTKLMETNKVPFNLENSRPDLKSPFFYAYHFDNHLVGNYLRKRSKNIEILDEVYTHASLNENGEIEKLHFESGKEIETDLVLDCTGFRKLLINKLYNVGWKSYQKNLPVNRALPFFLKLNEKNISNYTLAWAQKNGWMWQIPTQERIGAGYVYCDDFTSPEEAKIEIEKVLGHEIEPRNDIKFTSGRIEKSWVKNCIAIGLASGFLEPLEATSIHSTLIQMILFATDYLKEEMDFNNEKIMDEFNDRVGRQFDDFMIFLNTHYVSNRDDSDFWKYIKNECIHEDTLSLINKWKNQLPRMSDFELYLSGLPHVQSQLYYPVLDGLGLLQKDVAREEMNNFNLKPFARDEYKRFNDQYDDQMKRFIKHNDYLEYASL